MEVLGRRTRGQRLVVGGNINGHFYYNFCYVCVLRATKPPAVSFGLGMFPLVYDKGAEHRNGLIAMVAGDASANVVYCI